MEYYLLLLLLFLDVIWIFQSGRSAFSVAHHLNYMAASEALLKVTDKYLTGLQGDDDDDNDGVGDDYDPSVPETMQECDITYLYDTYDGKNKLDSVYFVFISK